MAQRVTSGGRPFLFVPGGLKQPPSPPGLRIISPHSLGSQGWASTLQLFFPPKSQFVEKCKLSDCKFSDYLLRWKHLGSFLTSHSCSSLINLLYVKIKKKKFWFIAFFSSILDLQLYYRQKIWGLIISTVVGKVKVEKLRLCPIKMIPLCAPAASPLKSKMLTASDEFFLTPDSLSVVDFSGMRSWSFLLLLLLFCFFFCRLCNSSSQPYDRNDRYVATVILTKH